MLSRRNLLAGLVALPVLTVTGKSILGHDTVFVNEKQKKGKPMEAMAYGYCLPISELDKDYALDQFISNAVKDCPYFKEGFGSISNEDLYKIYSQDIECESDIDYEKQCYNIHNVNKQQARLKEKLFPNTLQICLTIREDGHVELHY